MTAEVIVLTGIGYLFALGLLAFTIYIIADIASAIRHHVKALKRGDTLIHAKDSNLQ